MHIVDPKGLAVHYTQQRLYWVDQNVTQEASVLRSAKFDGSDYRQVFLYREVNNHTVSANVTDLVIDFFRNNTAFFLDASSATGDGAAIVSSNLDSPVSYNNATAAYEQFKDYYESKVVLTSVQEAMSTPTYLALDEGNQIVLWSDPALRSVGWARYKDRYKDLLNPGTVFAPLEKPGVGPNPYYVVGMAFDKGLGSPQWGRYLDCYGNGVCLGLEGNYVCQCNRGFYGDCQARSCPVGKAWFQEPVVDEVLLIAFLTEQINI